MNFQYQDLATPRVKQILRALSPAQRKALLTRLGKELEVLLKAHFAKREEDSPNKQGFPRSHWWAREVRAKTAFRGATADSATVGIDSRQFASKLKTTTIRPGPGRSALALPLRGEVYGVLARANTIPGLFVIRSKILGKAWLATREGGALRFYFRLVPSATIPPDPRALPPVADLQAAIEARAELEVKRIVQQ